MIPKRLTVGADLAVGAGLLVYAAYGILTTGWGVQQWVIVPVHGITNGYPAYPSSLLVIGALVVAAAFLEPRRAIIIGVFAAGTYDGLTSLAYLLVYHPPPDVLTISLDVYAYWVLMILLPPLLLKARPSLLAVVWISAAVVGAMIGAHFTDWFVLNDPFLFAVARWNGLAFETFVEVVFCVGAFLALAKRKRAP